MSDGLDILERNLAQLRRVEPELAERLRAQSPADLAWIASKSGPLTATLHEAGKSLLLASRYDPLEEAKKLIREVDFARHGAIVVLGLGLGYHVAELARQLTEATLLLVYEPDRALLRAVLEKVDHTAWLAQPNVLLLDEPVERGALIARIEPFAGMLTQGTVLVYHPPTRQRLPEKVNAFCNLVNDALGYCRLHVATMLVNSARTIENLMGNLPYYAAGPNTDELFQAARGYPAVCVSAGPSLAKNVDLLRDPAVRRNVVVITAQTTLKPLLDRGIQPDFVTALDYHEISRRFYEGLPELPNVTLVAETKAHPSILRGFPGPVRVAANRFLTQVLGPVAPPIRPIRQGATVAHLSFYLAQHLGCDPILFIGQDLGFSDGLYYCPGTAIHEVWAPELSPFNTLEMMEWQRIVRHRGSLEKRTDIHGRPMYADEQMITYLNQFERDFAQATQLIIDATEGGSPKAHTTRLSLRDALARYATRPVPPLPPARPGLDPQRLAQARQQVERRLEELRELRRLTQDTIPLLQRMIEHQRDYDKASRLYERVEKNRRRVAELGEIFAIVNDLNAIGVFKRIRADRAVAHAKADDPFAKQRLQLERDIENLNWLSQAIDEAHTIFRRTLEQMSPTALAKTSP